MKDKQIRRGYSFLKISEKHLYTKKEILLPAMTLSRAVSVKVKIQFRHYFGKILQILVDNLAEIARTFCLVFLYALIEIFDLKKAFENTKCFFGCY